LYAVWFLDPKQNYHFHIQSQTLNELYSRTSVLQDFKKSEYKVHQVGSKDSGTFLGLGREVVDFAQILRTAGDRRNQYFPYILYFPHTYDIWKVLVSLANIFFIANFHVLGLFIPKKERKTKFRLSRGVAGGFWTKFEVQLAQPC
jgi:hypothetical protein